ncbi:8261_t:CDS:2, partial [Gigaspora margarita]
QLEDSGLEFDISSPQTTNNETESAPLPSLDNVLLKTHRMIILSDSQDVINIQNEHNENYPIIITEQDQILTDKSNSVQIGDEQVEVGDQQVEVGDSLKIGEKTISSYKRQPNSKILSKYFNSFKISSNHIIYNSHHAFRLCIFAQKKRSVKGISSNFASQEPDKIFEMFSQPTNKYFNKSILESLLEPEPFPKTIEDVQSCFEYLAIWNTHFNN